MFHTRPPPPQVDCTAEVDLCRTHFITAFPTIRIFRHGSGAARRWYGGWLARWIERWHGPSCAYMPPHVPAHPQPHPHPPCLPADDVVRLGHHEHESYYGDRTKEDLVLMADALAQAAGQPHTPVKGVAKGSKSAGCNFSGERRAGRGWGRWRGWWRGGVLAAGGREERRRGAARLRSQRPQGGCAAALACPLAPLRTCPPLHPFTPPPNPHIHPPPPGFVLVKKVPGTLHFVARAPGHSFDYLNMNLSHMVRAGQQGRAGVGEGLLVPPPPTPVYWYQPRPIMPPPIPCTLHMPAPR